MRKNATKNKKSSISHSSNYDELSEFWDNHSLADYWDSTEEVDFDFSSNLTHRHLIALDPELLETVHKLAHTKGISTESLVNVLLQRSVHNLA